MKKMICLLSLLSLLLCSAVLPCRAEADAPRILLLGDSITYGYGLEGTRDTCASYGNLLREELGTPTSEFRNAAVNGYTSADLLALLPKIADDVKAADLIIISIGGNDLLGILWEAVGKLNGGTMTGFDQAIDIITDPEKTEKLIEQIPAAKVAQVVATYAVNLAGITSYIRSNNKDAEVIFLAQYDPTSGVEGFGLLSKIVSSAIVTLNATMKLQTAIGGCTYFDIYTPFVGHAVEWTNIASLDIHPSAEGHRKIFELLSEYLRSIPQDTTSTADTTETILPQDTTSPADTTETTLPQDTTLPVADTSEDISVSVTTIPDSETASFDTTTSTVDDTTLPKADDDKSSGGCGGMIPTFSLLAVLPAVIALRKKKHLTKEL